LSASPSGPSKSGKTILANKVIDAENLIPLTGPHGHDARIFRLPLSAASAK
jgi:hypothetical protein